VSDVSFHPIKNLALIGSLDGTWSFHDLVSGQVLGQYKESAPIKLIEFHPDGLVFVIGFETGELQIFDIRD
jgi:WD40 repeat protein